MVEIEWKHSLSHANCLGNMSPLTPGGAVLTVCPNLHPCPCRNVTATALKPNTV